MLDWDLCSFSLACWFFRCYPRVHSRRAVNQKLIVFLLPWSSTWSPQIDFYRKFMHTATKSNISCCVACFVLCWMLNSKTPSLLFKQFTIWRVLCLCECVIQPWLPHINTLTMMFTVCCSMLPVRPRMNVGSGLLGIRPPMNETVMPRMSGPLLQAPYELLPAPSRVDRAPPPPSPPPPPRPVMRMPSPVGFHREPSPPMFVIAMPVFASRCELFFGFNGIISVTLLCWLFKWALVALFLSLFYAGYLSKIMMSIICVDFFHLTENILKLLWINWTFLMTESALTFCD